jgi:hypothetical protein
MIYENIIVLCFPQIPNFNIPQNNHFTMRFGDCWLFELNCNNPFAIAPLCSTKRVLICIQNYKEFVVGLECIEKYRRKATTSGAAILFLREFAKILVMILCTSTYCPISQPCPHL